MLRNRLERLEGKRGDPVTVFLTEYETHSGEPELWTALVFFGSGQTVRLDRASDESEPAFRLRIDAAKARRNEQSATA
ncbi:hypothetical protein MCELHM10_01088 [Paracoccaceae bacterium]